MGAHGRRAGRRLRPAPVSAGEVATRERWFTVPSVGVFYAVMLGACVFAIDQLVQQTDGPWFEGLGGALLLASAVTTWRFGRAGWRRHREGLERRALLWGAGALGSVLLGLTAIYVIDQTSSFAAVISGADVRLTRPVLRSLPRPPGATLRAESRGLAGTESISDDFSTGNLAMVIPFYERSLARAGWTEDRATVGTGLVHFVKGSSLVTVAPDQPTGAGDFTITVDRINPDLLSPSASAVATPTP